MNGKIISPAILLFVCMFIPAWATGQSGVEQLHRELPTFMARGMADWGIPGMAVAVVKDGELVYAEGFGERKLDSDGKVDAHTVFGIASLTKAMTTAAIAMLVDEGKLGWDDRVKDHLPWFELSDPVATNQASIRDLLSHRVGIGRLTGNRLRFMPSRNPETIMGFVRHMPFEQPFRSGYVYNNMMYMVAGLVVEAASGMSWDEFMRERIFGPLGMTRASTSINDLEGLENTSWPHQEIFGEVQLIPRRNFDNLGPAASVNASVNDLAAWMIFQLGEAGAFHDLRLADAGAIAETHQPQQVFRQDDPMRDPLTGYGLGWGLRYYEGYRVSQHGGATDGMTSILVLLPEKELGLVVSSNLFCNFRPAVANFILDAMLGIEREDIDWHDYYYSRYLDEKAVALQRRDSIEARRIPGTSPSLPLNAYEGLYLDRVYDDLRIRLNACGQLEMQLWDDPEMIADLEHWHYDSFRATWRNPAMREKFVTFDIDYLGQPHRLNVHFTLRPVLISAGIYPTDYYRVVEFVRKQVEGGR